MFSWLRYKVSEDRASLVYQILSPEEATQVEDLPGGWSHETEHQKDTKVYRTWVFTGVTHLLFHFFMYTKPYMIVSQRSLRHHNSISNGLGFSALKSLHNYSSPCFMSRNTCWSAICPGPFLSRHTSNMS